MTGERMNVKFLNPFVDAAYEVLKAEAGCTMTRTDLRLEKNSYVTDEVTVILSLVGEVEGMVFYSMTETTSLNLASAMLGEKLIEFNSLAQSGVAELGNVITGRASVKLAEAGYQSTISPPTLLLGKDAKLSTLDFTRLVVPLGGSVGEITIHLALREGLSKGLTTAQMSVPSAPL
jgi:chemotaxis protein CheX